MNNYTFKKCYWENKKAHGLYPVGHICKETLNRLQALGRY